MIPIEDNPALLDCLSVLYLFDSNVGGVSMGLRNMRVNYLLVESVKSWWWTTVWLYVVVVVRGRWPRMFEK